MRPAVSCSKPIHGLLPGKLGLVDDCNLYMIGESGSTFTLYEYPDFG